jgi:hypothetical protein
MTRTIIQSHIHGREINMLDIHPCFVQQDREKITQQAPRTITP